MLLLNLLFCVWIYFIFERAKCFLKRYKRVYSEKSFYPACPQTPTLSLSMSHQRYQCLLRVSEILDIGKQGAIYIWSFSLSKNIMVVHYTYSILYLAFGT